MLQPERLQESCGTASHFLAPFQGVIKFSQVSGGLRSASTSGYYLANLPFANGVFI